MIVDKVVPHRVQWVPQVISSMNFRHPSHLRVSPSTEITDLGCLKKKGLKTMQWDLCKDKLCRWTHYLCKSRIPSGKNVHSYWARAFRSIGHRPRRFCRRAAADPTLWWPLLLRLGFVPSPFSTAAASPWCVASTARRVQGPTDHWNKFWVHLFIN